MNILVRPFDAHGVVFRPDTSWARLSDDLYLPDFVSGLSFTPVLYGRIEKPGKFIPAQSAYRYMKGDGGFGVLLYVEDYLRSSHESAYAQAICQDHTSYLSCDYKSIAPEDMAGKGPFTVSKNGKPLYRSPEMGEALPGGESLSLATLRNHLCEASERILVRAGDFFCIELSGRIPLMERATEKENPTIELSYLGTSLDFQIILK